jgi:hypothetical protein
MARESKLTLDADRVLSVLEHSMVVEVIGWPVEGILH